MVSEDYQPAYRPTLPAPVDMDVGIPVPPSLAQGDPAQPLVTWANRRRMAWAAFYAVLVAFPFGLYCALVLAQSDREISAVETIYGYFAMTMAGVILGYMGSSSLPFFGFMKGGPGK